MSNPSDRVLGTPPANTPVPDQPLMPPGSGPLYLPTHVSPEQIFVSIGQLRKEAREEIDRLVRFLDKTDDYVSRELEVEDGNDEPGGDDEPSLGSHKGLNQIKSWVVPSGDEWDGS